MEALVELLKGAFWVAAWEGLKQLFGASLKRFFDRADTTRKLIRDALGAATDEVHRCMSNADEYYTSSCDENRRSELSREIRKGMHGLACRLREIDLGLVAAGSAHLDRTLTVRFRQALTMRLDESGFAPVGPTDPLVSEIYRSAGQLSLALARAKFEHI